MPYDPNIPQEHTPLDAAPIRAQFNGLKALIDAVAAITSAQVDSVNTLPPGNAAQVSVSLAGGTLRFTFDIPSGADGAPGQPGSNGADGGPGPGGPQGLPGEVSQTDLNNAVLTLLGQSSNISNGVNTLSQTAESTYNPTQMQEVLNKLDQLINALRR